MLNKIIKIIELTLLGLWCLVLLYITVIVNVIANYI